MFKKLLLISGLCLCGVAFAQVPTFQAPKNAQPKGPKYTLPPSSSLKPVSASDFSKNVTKKAAENEAEFKQDLDKKLASVPPPQVKPAPASLSKSVPQMTEPATKTTTVSPAKAALTPAPAEEETETPTTPPPPATLPAATPKPVPPPAATAPTPTTPPYTGFGTQQPQQEKNTGGGWNVKY